MSLLSSFLASHLIPALEQALIAHEPEVQTLLINEIKTLADNVGAWVDSKIHQQPLVKE